ncbi:MAG: hypothetical protein K2Q01_08660 [Rickettsiales bacterium]|nr:hypothetical protein [Rickettsiales bacterium]
MPEDNIVSGSAPVHDLARMVRVGDTKTYMVISTDKGLDNISSITDVQRKALKAGGENSARRHILLLDRTEKDGVVTFIANRAFTGSLKTDDSDHAPTYNGGNFGGRIEAESTLHLKANGAVETLPEQKRLHIKPGSFRPSYEGATDFIEQTSKLQLGKAGGLERALAQAADSAYEPLGLQKEGVSFPTTMPLVAKDNALKL